MLILAFTFTCSERFVIILNLNFWKTCFGSVSRSQRSLCWITPGCHSCSDNVRTICGTAVVLYWHGAVRPSREWVQRKHDSTPTVDGQTDAANPNDVHHHTCFSLKEEEEASQSLSVGFRHLLLPITTMTHHVGHFEETVGEDDGIGGRGHWEHESKGSAEGAGDHHIQWVQAHRLGLWHENNLCL